MDIWAIVNQYGLPLGALVVLMAALSTGKLRMGGEVDTREKKLADQWALERAEFLSQIAYRDGLRQEEKVRGDRLEVALGAQTTVLRDVTEVLKDVEREVVRQPRAARRGPSAAT